MTALKRSATASINHPCTFEGLKGLRARGYIRDSSLDQKDGFGPEIQLRNIKRFAESCGLILNQRCYTEFITGRSVDKRTEFRLLLDDARKDLYDVLLVDHTSRFGRNQAECIRYKGELQGLGKVVVFVSQGIISGSDRDFLSERINETLDEAYSRNLSRYVREGKARKADAGHALGHPPLGYRSERARSGRGAWAVPDDSTMPTLLDLLRGYAGGDHSFKTLAMELNAKGYRTKRGKPFTEGSIHQVLDNPFYNGKFYYHKGRPDEDLRDGVHRVSQELKALWASCQEVRRGKAYVSQPAPRSRHQRVYPLTGILVCDGCGEPFHGVSSVSKPRSYPRMFHSLRRCGMRPLSVAAPALEREFAERVLSCIKLDDRWQQTVLSLLAKEGPGPDRGQERKRIDGAMANLKKQHLWGVVSDREFKAEYQTLVRGLKALEPSVSPGGAPDLERAGKLLTDMPALWQHPGVSPLQRQALAREVFVELRLREGKLAAVKPRPGYAPLFAYSIWRSNVVGDTKSS